MEDAKNIAKTYDPSEFEDRIYNEWLKRDISTLRRIRTESRLQ